MEKTRAPSFWGLPFWERGFRPFFLMGSIYSVLTIFLWSAFYVEYFSPPTFFLDPISWHAHEMIYGFAMAIVAGFLLTAVANWTGGAPARQMHLAGLCILWLLGRVVLNVNLGLPHVGIIIIAASFVPALTVSLAIPLFRSWNKRNFIFLTLLSVLWGCDIWFLMTLNLTALHVSLMMILIMISLIGGRIIPAFTVAALRRKGIQSYQTAQLKLDVAALVSLLCVTLCLVFAKNMLIFSICAAVSCVLHVLRMRHYHTLKTFDDPLVWILHVGYAWLVLGLGLLSLAGLQVLPISASLHALTAGCIGSMILGMICRVTLGHTGRNLTVHSMTGLSFILIQFAVLMRVLGPIFVPSQTTLWIIGSACIWSICFAIYILFFAKILMTSRVDELQT